MWPIVYMMAILIGIPMTGLAVLIVWMAKIIAYENGHYDHKRREPWVPPYHPEYHSQLKGRDAVS
jgi:hypothetical protein